jgi:DNA-binding beta-propeller fold protein YncE
LNRKLILLSSLFALCCYLPAAQAQAPQRPLLPHKAWALPGYHAVPSASAFKLPADLAFDSVAAVTMNPAGNLLVLQRGPHPFLEFASDGTLVRTFGDGANYSRTHGLRFDKDGNLWMTDVGLHVVQKLDPNGKVLMTLGTSGKNGIWDEANGAHLFDQPNETAFDSHGNLYVVQGHGVGEPRVLKFSSDGTFIKQWGSRGTEPGQFFAAHAIEIDANDVLYVADRENFRIQRFDTEGTYLGEWKYEAMVCGLHLHDDGYLYMTSGFDGEFGKIDMQNGTLLGTLGSPGTGVGQFGEAHYLTLDAAGNVYVADVVNRRVEKYVKE